MSADVPTRSEETRRLLLEAAELRNVLMANVAAVLRVDEQNPALTRECRSAGREVDEALRRLCDVYRRMIAAAGLEN